jgi:hypothetical protein
MNLFEVAREIANRLTRIFLRDKSGRRPVYGGTEKFQADPYWKDYVLFYENFHGDNGAGLPPDRLDRPCREPNRDLRLDRRETISCGWQERCICQGGNEQRMTISNRPICIQELDFDGLTRMLPGLRSNGLLPSMFVNVHPWRDEDSIIQNLPDGWDQICCKALLGNVAKGPD